jgi:hypothetical protein
MGAAELLAAVGDEALGFVEGLEATLPQLAVGNTTMRPRRNKAAPGHRMWRSVPTIGTARLLPVFGQVGTV